MQGCGWVTNGNLQDQRAACHVVHGCLPGHGPCPLADDHSLNEAREEYECKRTKDGVQRDEVVTSLEVAEQKWLSVRARWETIPGTERLSQHWWQDHLRVCQV